MGEEDPQENYRNLPPQVDPDQLVVEVDTSLASVEQPGRDHNNGADPYLRITGWLPPSS